MDIPVFYLLIVILLVIYFYNNSKSKKATKILENGGVVIDVRTPQEFKAGNYKSSINIPLNNIEDNIDKIKSFKKNIVVVCASGMRSGKANKILNKYGIKSINGGSWSNLK